IALNKILIKNSAALAKKYLQIGAYPSVNQTSSTLTGLCLKCNGFHGPLKKSYLGCITKGKGIK
uniref:hypothetical protein n=1 Tax=Ferruginibacter sp. TaxID=1940288 RepID=UPI00374CB61C